MTLWLSLTFTAALAGAAEVAPQETSARIVGARNLVAYRRVDGALLLDAKATAEAFGWTAKVVSPGKLLTICRDEAGGVCIPVRIAGEKHTIDRGRLFVDAAALARALRFAVDDRDGSVTLRPTTQTRTEEDPPAYNAAWPEGRGFGVGDTLPDIPLYGMDGKEVRFSQFLGKQYILYCWASW